MDRVRGFLGGTVFQLIVTAFMIGIAWQEIKSSIELKADKKEVVAVADSLAKKTGEEDKRQSDQLTQIAADMGVVKSLLCKQYTGDSFCRKKN